MTSSSIYIYITHAINLLKLHLNAIGALYYSGYVCSTAYTAAHINVHIKCKRQCNDLLSVCTSAHSMCVCAATSAHYTYKPSRIHIRIGNYVASIYFFFWFVCVCFVVRRMSLYKCAAIDARQGGFGKLSHWDFFLYNCLVGFTEIWRICSIKIFCKIEWEMLVKSGSSSPMSSSPVSSSA